MSDWAYDPSFIRAESLAEAIARISAITGVRPENTRGEKRALLALRDALELDVPTVATNASLGSALAHELGVAWYPDRYVDKTTLTLDGVNALLHGASLAYREGALTAVQADATPGLDGAEWSQFEPAVSKIEAVTRISALTGSAPEYLGPGSKEHKSVLINLAARILPEIDQAGLSKTRLAREIARALDVPWGDHLISTGETIRLTGLNVILAGAERMLRRLGLAFAHGLTAESEGAALVDALQGNLLGANEKEWDGRQKTIWLQKERTNQEYQMEWPGFYFEFRGKEVLNRLFRPNPFPPQAIFANTTFDYALNHVWDLKSHTTEMLHPHAGSTKRLSGLVQLNDVAAIRACVEAQGLGFIVLSGRAVMDEDGSFKRWHDALKGKTPTPSLSGKSRMRKTAFRPVAVEAFWIPDENALNGAVLNGAMKVIAQGRQQSGAKRPDKFGMRLSRARSVIRVAYRTWESQPLRHDSASG